MAEDVNPRIRELTRRAKKALDENNMNDVRKYVGDLERAAGGPVSEAEDARAAKQRQEAGGKG